MAETRESVTLALLHLAPRPGEIERNKQMVKDAMLCAASHGARFIITPELAVSGYGFRDAIGTDWIARDQAALIAWAAELARKAAVFLLLGMPEAEITGRLFNSMLLFGPDGTKLGRHRKVNVLKVGSESWSSPGESATMITVEGVGRIGLFVCADMHSQRLVRDTAALDLDLLVSGAAWAPGEHGPNGEWEWASMNTQRPVLVCNRTGVDVLDFRAARSVAAVAGSIAHSHASPEAALVLVDWIPRTLVLANWRVIA